MADNILSAKILVTAPGAAQTFNSVATSAAKTEVAIKKIVPGVNQANVALINLGRVAQDLPFGIIGIANNLNPLLESFQRTQKEAGGFGNALKALGKSLLGGGGLGFALSLVTGAMSFFALANNGASKAVEENNKATEEAAHKQDELKRALDAAASATINQADKIAELKKLLVDTSNEYINLTKAVINQGVAQFLFSQKQEAVQKILSRAINDRINAQKKLIELGPVQEFDLSSLNKQAGDVNKIQPFSKKLADNTKIIGVQIDAVSTSLRKNADAAKADKNALIDINNIAASLGITFDKFVDKSTKQGSAVKDEVKKRRDEIFFGLRDLFNIDLSKNEKGVKDLSTGISGVLRRGVTAGISDAEFDILKRIDELNNDISKAIQTGLISAFAGFGEGLGDVLAGGDAQKGFQVFASSLAGIIKNIGKLLIEFGVTSKAVKIALGSIFKNPALAIAAGIALVAVGSAFQKLASGGIKGFAAGGRVRAGVPIMVGEQGREVFVPDSGGRIIPNHQLGSAGASIGGGGMIVQVVGTNVIRGNDLITIFSATQRSQSRLI